MYRFHLYNADEINKLKQELNTYKKVMKTMEADDLIEDLVKTNADYCDLIEEIIKLKGEMKMMEESYQKKIVDYDNKEQDISTQIKTLDIAFVQLREDVNKIKENMDRFRVNETTEKTNEVIQKPEQGDKAKDETDGLKSEVVQLKKEINPHNSKSNRVVSGSTPRISEFRQLKNMLQSTDYPELTQNKQENKLIKNQTFQKPLITGKKKRNVKLQQITSQDIPLITNEKKYYRHSQYGINKNIITRVTTSKYKEKEEHKVGSKEKSGKENNQNILELEEQKGVQTEQIDEQKDNQIYDESLLASEVNEMETKPLVSEERRDDKKKSDETQNTFNENSKMASLFTFFKKR